MDMHRDIPGVVHHAPVVDWSYISNHARRRAVGSIACKSQRSSNHANMHQHHHITGTPRTQINESRTPAPRQRRTISISHTHTQKHTSLWLESRSCCCRGRRCCCPAPTLRDSSLRAAARRPPSLPLCAPPVVTRENPRCSPVTRPRPSWPIPVSPLISGRSPPPRQRAAASEPARCLMIGKVCRRLPVHCPHTNIGWRVGELREGISERTWGAAQRAPLSQEPYHRRLGGWARDSHDSKGPRLYHVQI